MSRRRISIRTKLLALTLVLLIGAVTSYLALAIRLFEADKTAYIYDGNAAPM